MRFQPTESRLVMLEKYKGSVLDKSQTESAQDNGLRNQQVEKGFKCGFVGLVVEGRVPEMLGSRVDWRDKLSLSYAAARMHF